MKYQIVEKKPVNQPIVIAFFDDQHYAEQAHINQFKLQDFFAAKVLPKSKQSGLWLEVGGEPVLLYNLGPKDKYTHQRMSSAVQSIFKQIKSIEPADVTLSIPSLTDTETANQQLIIAIDEQFYSYKLSHKTSKDTSISNINLLIDAKQQDIKQALALAEGMKFAKDLGNAPANLCTPTILAEKAQQLATESELVNCHVLGEQAMKERGMNTILAVSQGSSEEAKFIELSYRNAGDAAPIVLVGKGVTFDSGGLSLKPPTGMTEMKFDMCGAAAVLGTMKAIIELQLPLNVTVLVAASENLPGPDALRPGDIVESYSKKMVEILNTDAEGRLLLCDALTYAEQLKPSKIIDVATLTGAIIIALGNCTNGIMSNNQQLCDDLLNAGQQAQDKAWQLPLWEDYQSLMDSNVADVCNMASDRGAGSISAACFLSRFIDNTPWAHIDCAGTAWKSGKNKLASGRPVPLLLQFLINETMHSND